MAITMAVWSLVLTPGKSETVLLPCDLRITNVALGEELADVSGRTTLKLLFKPITAHDEDDDDDDDDEENDDKDQTPTSSSVLCSLTPGKIEQSTLDLVLEEEKEYIFEVIGKNAIHLTGNYIDQNSADQPPYGDSDSEDDEDAFDLRDVSSDVEIDPAELGSDASRFEEMADEETTKSLKRPRASDTMDTDAPISSKADKKNKNKNKKLKAETGEAVATGVDTDPKKPEDKKEKKAKKDKEGAANGEESGKKEKSTVVTKELAGGLKIKDAKTGTGPMAKKGNTIGMRYIGKLQNGKVFDKNVKGKPFIFRLGQGEVIKGWDEGLVGMQVGGERVLTIPPALAYGKKGTDGIPSNSTLTFECKLVEIK